MLRKFGATTPTSDATWPPASSRPLLRLLAGDRHQHFLLPGRGLPWFLGAFFRPLVSAVAPPTLLRSASIRSTTFSPRADLRRDRLAGALLVDQVDERGLIVVLELFRFEAP
jgi:hypothetical protein